MKKLFSLFVPLMALFLTLVPLTARAQYTGSANGHDWVILWEGGPRWATVNVGASSETDAGNYYMWGGTDSDATCLWGSYPYKGSNQNTAPYNKYGYAKDGLLELQPNDDAATQAWGQGWRTPTKIEMDDLKVYCNLTYDATNRGVRYTSKTTGQSIFLRSAGYKGNGSNNGTTVFIDLNNNVSNIGRGKYLTATSTQSPGSNKYEDCYYLYWYTKSGFLTLDREPSTTTGNRYTGMSVRAIYVPSELYDVTVQADNTGYGTVGGTTSMEDVVESSSITIDGNTLTLDDKTATATPAAADADYIYYFTGWTSGGNAVANGDALSGDMTITANFARKSSNCTVTIATPAGYGNISVSDGINTYAVGQSHTFNRYTDNGKVLTVTATPNTNCMFTSWIGDLTQTGTNPYTATYTIGLSTPDNMTIGATFAQTYTVTFKDYNGNNLVTPFALEEGQVPVYSGSTPSRTGYVFTGWTDGNSAFTDRDDALPALTSNVVYTATYVEEPDYFTITNNASSNKTITVRKGNGTSTKPSFKYCIYNSSGTITTNWTTLNVTNTTGTNITIPAGGKLQMYGNNATLATGSSDYTKFTLTSNIKISGNILSLVACSTYGATIDNNFSMPNYCFYRLFYYQSSTTDIDAEDLELPSTIVSQYAYAEMFKDCVGLIKAPKELPATTLSGYCYQKMFENCSTMVSCPEVLPALDLPTYCYDYMFSNCKKITDAPEILATTNSGNYSCEYMFYFCTSLTKAPSELRITSVKNNGYYSMFQSCTSLEVSPNIRATSYGNSNSLYMMFADCTKLRQIRTYATSWGYSSNWARSVKNAGVFYCPPTLSRATFGTSNIPLSTTYPWTVFSYNITFVPKSCSWTDETNANKQFTWETDTTNVMTFLRAESADNAKFYTDATCTTEISVADIKAALATQQESNVNTTKNYYVKKSAPVYTITWMNESGTGEALETDADQDYGTTTAFNGATPTKIATAQYTYTFDGWATEANGAKVYNDGETPTVSGDATYYAHFSAATRTYTVNIASNNNNYGTVSQASVANVPYNTQITTGTGDNANKVTINGTQVTATKHAADAQYTYAFTGWTNGTETVTGALTVTANFTRTTNQYTLNVSAGANGTVTGGGTYNYGASAELTATPAEGYHFVSWSDGGAQTHSVTVTDITAAQTYTATFAPNATYYILTISAGENGTVDTSVNGSKEEGTNVKISATANTFYQFDQWSDGNKDNPRTVTMNEDKTLTASFKLADVIELEDQHEAGAAWWTDYDNLRTTLGSTTVTVQYNRTMEANKWHVVALPFEFNLLTNPSHPFSGHIYEMKGATYTDEGCLDFNFMPMTTIMTPNKPYIFFSNETAANVTFANVELQAVAPYTGEDTRMSVTGGEVIFRNTICREKLNSAGGENKQIVYIYDNRLYYPKASEIWMRAFRGYFFMDVTDFRYIKPRVKIINNGHVTTALEAVESGNETEAKKYVERGMLIIERNGIRYNAQGGRIE